MTALTGILHNDKKHLPVDRYFLYFLAIIAIILAIPPWYSNHLQNESARDEEKGDLVKSLHEAKQAVSINPISVEARFILAGAQQRLGRETEARSTLIKATELQPLNYATWEVLALYERDRWGQQDLAQEYFKTALGLNPFDKQLNIEAGEKEIDET